MSPSPRCPASPAASNSSATSPSSASPRSAKVAIFSGISITERLTPEERTCGVCVVDLTTGKVVALLRFDTAVQEIFALAWLPGLRFPDLINDDEALLENSFTVPDAALADVPASLQVPTDLTRSAAGSDRE